MSQQELDTKAYAPRNMRGKSNNYTPKKAKGTLFVDILPERGKAETWRIYDANSIEDGMEKVGVDPKARIIVTPLDNSSASREIRAKQLGHIRYSPKTKPTDVHPLVLGAVEDMRVNALLRRDAGVHHDPTYAERFDAAARKAHYRRIKDAFSMLVDMEPAEQILAAVSAIDSQQEAAIFAVIPPDVSKVVKKIYEGMWAYRGGAMDFQTTYDLALALEQYLGNLPQGEAPFDFVWPDWMGEGLVGGGRGEDGEDPLNMTVPEGEEIPSDLMEVQRHRAVPLQPVKLDLANLSSYYKYAVPGVTGGNFESFNLKQQTRLEREVSWTTMTIHMPEMSLPAVPPNHSKSRQRWRGSDKGAIPMHMHRYCIDYAVFGKKDIRKAGIALLVDTSGSMSFSKSDADRILNEVPTATLATYSSRGGNEGHLIVLASKGRRVDPKKVPHFGGSGNGCDGPALEWLARQQGTKYWLSDGGVTGLGDEQRYGHIKYCFDICIAEDIYQVPNVDALMAVLNGKVDLPPLRVSGMKHTGG